jgi:hypothetical protein
MQYWLQDKDANTLDLGLNVQQITLGANKRDFKVTSFAGAPGGFIRGFGTPDPKKFVVSRQERIQNGDVTAWNSARMEFMKWFTRSRTEDIYLHIKLGDESIETKTLVYCTKLGADKFKNQKITDSRPFELISPKGILEKIPPAETGSEEISEQDIIDGDGNITIPVTNDGLWETPLICEFTPTGDEFTFGVQTADQFGFVLTGVPFPAGKKIIYNTGDNSLSIDGIIQKTINFLTSGGVFNLPPGDSDLVVNVSGAGNFTYIFTERYS